MTSVEALNATLRRLEKERLALVGQIQDLTQDSSEHRLVLKNLSKLPSDRRCYRIVGGVAVERTVEEVQPSLAQQADALDEFKEKLNKQLEVLNEEIKKVAASLQSHPEDQ